MNKLRIERDTIYKIEVNDEGDIIEFDLEDINLPFKCYDALEGIDRITGEFYEKLDEINKSNDDNRTKKNKIQEITNNSYVEMRKIMDSFLGDGACQKIFGDVNYENMFYDLLDELQKPREELNGKSHFDMLELTQEGINKRIANKYGKNKKQVI